MATNTSFEGITVEASWDQERGSDQLQAFVLKKLSNAALQDVTL